MIYERYLEGEITLDEQLGVHFATINHDLPHLITWLNPSCNRRAKKVAPA